MEDQRRAPAYLDEIRALMHEAADDPAAILAALEGHLETEEFATSMYLLWGLIGDTGYAADAAREWLALDHRDRDAVRGYYDHWLFEVCGYQRP
ncbi:hypothetical protein [Paractinoplanes brasiliensis]|nr:hypothetical protein [Actinoplanes brasiliensis]